VHTLGLINFLIVLITILATENATTRIFSRDFVARTMLTHSDEESTEVTH
jgi:hypothetical protein